MSNFGGIDPDPGGLGAEAPQRGPGAEPLGGVWGRSPQENFARNAYNLLIFMHIKYVSNVFPTSEWEGGRQTARGYRNLNSRAQPWPYFNTTDSSNRGSSSSRGSYSNSTTAATTI